MNDKKIEEVLRKAPAPKAPEALLEKLTTDIRVAKAPAQPTNWSARPSWARRWLPALSFAGLFLACVVAIAVQTNVLSELNRDNDQLRAAKENLDTLRGESVEYKKLLAESGELERMRKDYAEIAKLRTEAAQLQTQLGDMAKLRQENVRLKAQASSQVAAPPSDLDADAYAKAQARAERINCINNLKQIGLAGRIWAGDHDDTYPPNFICMANELGNWKILHCPSDKVHQVANGRDVEAGNISYVMDAPGIKDGGLDYDPRIVFVECPIHHNVSLIDGSAHMLTDESYAALKVVKGRKMMMQP